MRRVALRVHSGGVRHRSRLWPLGLLLAGALCSWAGPAPALESLSFGSASPFDAEQCSQFGHLCFDLLASGSDAARSDLEGVVAGPALVLSETDAATLTGFDTTAWATSGDQGLLNTLAPTIELDFETTIVSVLADVLSLPGPAGEPLPVVLQAWNGSALVGIDISNLALVGDSGLLEDTLGVEEEAGITRISLFAGIPCDGMLCFDEGPTSSFWVDTVRFRAVPEPATALFLIVGLVGWSRRRSSQGPNGGASSP